MTEQIMEKPGIIKSVVKAANILNLLADREGPMSLAKMATELNMSKSTLHGIISTLVEVRFLSQDQETGGYFLGTRLFEIGNCISRQWNERKIAYPYMQQIVAEVKETAHMAILDDYEVLYINKQESTNSVRIVTDVGIRLPAHCTGLGKALLSGLNTWELEHMIHKKGLKQYTSSTITDSNTLCSELKQIQECGYAIDEQEYIEGLKCIAVPILNHAKKIVAAISISGPTSRMHDEKFERCKEILLKAGKEISAKMGYEGG